MDARNERLVFSLLSACSCESESQPQYFLITPKLLPHLKFNRGTTVHLVYNGPGVDLSGVPGRA